MKRSSHTTFMLEVLSLKKFFDTKGSHLFLTADINFREIVACGSEMRIFISNHKRYV